MAKKNFQSGLDTLFTNAFEETSQKAKGTVKAATKPATTKKGKNNNKSFASDLDTFFQTTLEETVTEQVQKAKQKTKTSKTKKTTRKKPLFGLDSLIRTTVETSTVKMIPNEKKRVTFIFDKRKIEKLKKIARLEKSYLKDIINQLVSEYIDDYDKGN